MTLFDAFAHLFTPLPFLIMLGGVLLGIAVGVMPGITAGMLLALTLPFTYGMKSVDAIILLVSMFVGGVSGGLVTATLMRIPGEPSAIMTTLDGYPLAKKGFPGRALGLGNAASIVGGTLSWVALRPGLATFAMAATFGYVLALHLGLSFRWATMLFLAALGIAMSDRSPRHLAIAAVIAIVGGIGVDLLFGRLLMVQLP